MPPSPAAAAAAVAAGLSFPEFVELLILCACWASPPPSPLPPDSEHVVRACSALLRRLIGSGGGISGGGGGGAARGVARANGLVFRRAAFASQRLQEALEAMREQLALAHAAHAAHAPRVAGALPALRIGSFLRMVEAAALLGEGKVDEGNVGGVGAAQAVRAFVCSLPVDAAPEGEPALAAGDEFHEAVRAVWSQCPSGQWPSSTPAPPQDAPGGSWRLDTSRRERRGHCSSSHYLGCLSWPPRRSPIPLPLAIQVLRLTYDALGPTLAATKKWEERRRKEEAVAQGSGPLGLGSLGPGPLGPFSPVVPMAGFSTGEEAQLIEHLPVVCSRLVMLQAGDLSC